MSFVLPPKSQVGVLDLEIAGEGQQVIMSDGEQVNWTPPPAKPVMPDWSQIKSIARYFNRSGYAPWPAWLFHPTEAPRLVKNADEGAALGVCYRKATPDEIARYGHTSVWDWEEGSKWRARPYEGTVKFDPAKPEHGKTVIYGTPNPVHAQNDLVRMIVPEVAEAVARALKGTGPNAPAHIDPAEWEEFKQFLAFKKSQEAVGALAAASDDEPDAEAGNALSLTPTGVSEDQERSLWIEEAQELDIKIDKRWGVDRLKSEVEKARKAA